MLSDDENNPQRKKVGKTRRRPLPRRPISRRERLSRWALRPLKRGAEKAMEHAAAKIVGAILFWLGLFGAMAFAHYADVLHLPSGWNPEIHISPPATMPKGK